MSRRQPLTDRRLASYVLAVLLAATAAGCGDDAPGPVPVTPPTPASAAAKACGRFLGAVPSTVDSGERIGTAPASELTAVWRVRVADPATGDERDGDIVVRCGVPEPTLPPTAPLRVINDVDWYNPELDLTGPNVYTTVGRVAAVELTIPAGRAPAGALVDLADAVKQELPLTK